MTTVRNLRDEQIAREATQWLERLAEPTPALNERFADWLTQSPDHVRHLLEATAVLEETSRNMGYNELGGIAVATDDASFRVDDERCDSALLSRGDRSRSDAIDTLARAVSHLPEHCRHVVTLRKVYGLSKQQIADRLELSREAVEDRLSLAVRALSRTLPAGTA
jgi:RNA polymerase sigma factor (sigma-70 family)